MIRMSSTRKSELSLLLKPNTKKVFNPETRDVELQEINEFDEVDLENNQTTNFKSTAANLTAAFQNNKRAIGASLAIASIIILGGITLYFANKLDQEEKSNNTDPNNQTNTTMTFDKELTDDHSSTKESDTNSIATYSAISFVFSLAILICKACSTRSNNHNDHQISTSPTQRLPSTRNFGTFENKLPVAPTPTETYIPPAPYH